MEIANYALYGISIAGLIFLLWLFVKNELTLEPISLFKIFLKLNKIMASQAELAQALVDLKTQLTKVAGEITGQIQALEDALANAGGTTPEVDAALAEVKTAVQALDDLNPDKPEEPSEPTEETE